MKKGIYKYEVEIVFSRPRQSNILTDIILFFTKWWLKGTKYEGAEPTHVAVLLDNRRVIEALPFDGVRVVDLDVWLKENVIVERHLFLHYMPRAEIFETIRKFYGKDYDFLGAGFAGIYSLCRRFCGKRFLKRNWLESEDKFFCVELVLEFYSKYDFLGFDSNWISLISPAEFLAYIENR